MSRAPVSITPLTSVLLPPNVERSVAPSRTRDYQSIAGS